MDPTYEANKTALATFKPTDATWTPNFRYTPPPAPATPPPPPTPNPIDTYYSNLNTKAPDEQTIREQARQNSQSYIDAVNARYQTLLNEQTTINQDLTGQTRSTAARSGTLGSDFGNTDLAKRAASNEQSLKNIEAQRGQELAGVYQQIDTRAREEIAAQKAQVLNNQGQVLQHLEKQQADARTLLPSLAKIEAAGTVIDPAKKAELFRQSGYDPLIAEAIYNGSKPVAGQVTYAYHNLGDGVVLRTGVKPDGTAVPEQKFNYDMPKDSTLTVTPDGTPLIFDKKSGTATIAPGFHEGQFAKATAEDYTREKDKKLTENSQKLGTYLTTKAGADSYVSPSDYKAAKNAWVADGYQADDFDQRFSNFVNPTHAQDYGVKWKIDPLTNLLITPTPPTPSGR